VKTVLKVKQVNENIPMNVLAMHLNIIMYAYTNGSFGHSNCNQGVTISDTSLTCMIILP
jgi:hypothetical protein